MPYSPGELNFVRETVVEIGKGDPVFGSDRLPDNDFVDVVELVPIFVQHVLVFHQRLELRTAWRSWRICKG